ncbi:MAG: class I SAM-dependent methyltransferase [Planctomycetota bacterium]|nr:class I SAM-dependent methyltransferase [Planctomycetota bacterium]
MLEPGSPPEAPAGRVDYDRIAARYDEHRSWDDEMARRLIRLAAGAPGIGTLLELGAGTGNLTGCLERNWPGAILALDRSRGMLSKARPKLSRAALVRADASCPPLGPAQLDAAVGTFFLHHLDEAARRRLFRGLRLALRPGGGAAFLTTDHAQIRACALARWFPSVARIDCARFPEVGRVLGELRDAGFVGAGREGVVHERGPGGAEYLEKVRARFISTLDLLEPAEFDAGLAAMRTQLERDGRLGEISWRGTVVYARAPGG